MRYALFVAVSLSLVCVACTPPATGGEDAVSSSSRSSLRSVARQSSSKSAKTATTKAAVKSSAKSIARSNGSKSSLVAKGVYTALKSDAIGNGKPSVLFFHASWCPVCKADDQLLSGWYAGAGYPLTVYKVDYDTQADLKKRYGVTYQHTYVLIDGEGKAVKTVQSPSDSQLQALLATKL